MSRRQDKSFVFHSIMASVLSLAAYISWSEPSLLEHSPETVRIVADRGPLKALGWQDDLGRVTLVRQESGVTLEVTPTPRETGHPPAKRRYPGTPLAEGLLERIRGLPALRSLGVVDPNTHQAFGLSPPRATLTLVDIHGEQTVSIGEPVFGGTDLYAIGPTQEVFIVRGNTLNNLTHGAITLQDRELLGVKREAIVSAVLRSGTRERRVAQQHRHDASNAFFADPSRPERRLDQLSALIERALRLRVTEPLAETHSSDPFLTLVLLGEGGDDDVVAEVAFFQTAEGPLARSKRFGGFVGLQRLAAESMLADIDSAMDEGR